MIHKSTEFYPPWFCFCIVIVGCIVLPLFLILGGLLNKISYNKVKAELAKANEEIEDAVGEGVMESFGLRADVTGTEPVGSVTAKSVEDIQDSVNKNTSVARIPFPATTEGKTSGRLEYLKKQRLSRQVNPREARKFRK